ncbi:MAG: aminotransferase class I/II-fold pyridoxal phosphate-dependent enzyme, partial [Actinomycetota bacterium]
MAGLDEGRGAISPRLAEVIRHEGMLLDALDAVRREAGPGECDLQYGNPKEDPLPGLVEALHQATRPRGPDTFAYIASDPAARRLIAEGLEARFGMRFDPRDVCLTCGAFGALAAVFSAVVGEGDEVIVNRPSWWFYGAMIRMAGGTPVDVDVSEGSWDIVLAAIRGALGERT